MSGGIPSLTPYAFMPHIVTTLPLPMTSPELLRRQSCPDRPVPAVTQDTVRCLTFAFPYAPCALGP